MSVATAGAALPSARLLARNVGLNALGWLLPLVLALGAIPILVRGLGTERFGVLSLAWTLVGYFSLFDLGLGRALTQLVAAHLSHEAPESARELPSLVWTALWLLAPLGLVGGLAVAALAPVVVERVLDVPGPLRDESVQAFRLLAVAVPFTVATAGIRGVLEAVQAFGRINLLRIPLALLTFVAPVLVLPFSRGLPATMAVIAVGRVLLWGAHVWLGRGAVDALRHVRAPARRHLRPLLRVGGWMTVSNIVSPLMYSLDRFAVAAVLSVAAVSYYATAYEAVTRLWVVTSIVLPVLFPALAQALPRDPAHAAALLDRGARATLGAVFPAALALSALAPEWLTVWLGPAFGTHAAVLAQGLAAAVFVNVAGQIAYTVLQASGRADVTGRLHLLELMPYVATLWALIHTMGTIGVVVAWGGRVLVDTVALLWTAGRLVPATRGALQRAGLQAALGTPFLLAPAWIAPLGWRIAFAAGVLGAYALYAVTRLVTADERSAMRDLVRRRAAGVSGAAASDLA